MPGNPQIALGSLNRIKASVQVAAFPQLNVTASYLGKEGISLAPEGKATDIIDAMAGTVNSPVPYVHVTVTIHLLKTQSFSAQYFAQFQQNTVLGTVVVTPDASTFPQVTILNAALEDFKEMPMNGSDAGYVVTITGYWVINNNLWN